MDTTNGILELNILDNIKEKINSICSAEKKVAKFVLQNPQKTVDSTVSCLAKLTGVSDATVVRMCNHLGYKGYYQFRIVLSNYLGREQYHQALEKEKKEDAIDVVFNKHIQNVSFISKHFDKKIALKCINLIKKCSQAHILSVGNTAPLSQYMGFRLGRIGVRCTYNFLAEYFMNQINLASKNDILICISQSGTSKQVIQGIELGKQKGLKSIAITAFADSPIACLCDYVLLSTVEDAHFNYHKNYSHLNEMLIIDTLLTIMTSEELIKANETDKLELILSEYKV